MSVQSFKLYLSAVLFLMVFSCQPAPIPQPSTGDEVEDDDRGRGRYSRTRRDRTDEARTRRSSCRNFGEQSDYKCAGDEECEEVCDDLFAIKKYELECLELPAELVYAFEELLVQVNQGQADDIDSQALHCLLNIDDQDFLSEVTRLSVRESEDFLQQIASDEGLARVLGEYDEGYDILETLLNNISNTIKGSFEADIAGNDVTFLDLILAADNEAAFGWFDSYIHEYCRSGTNCNSADDDDDNGPFVAYCEIYQDKFLSTKQSWKFLKRSGVFKEFYEDSITDKDCGVAGSEESCDYDDFCDWREVCDSVYGVEEGTGYGTECD